MSARGSLAIALLGLVLWPGCRRSASDVQDAGPQEHHGAIAKDTPSAEQRTTPGSNPVPAEKRPAADLARREELAREIDWQHVAFSRYVHGRCGEVNEGATNDECAFALDIPTFLRKVPSAATDGRCFRHGHIELSGWAYPSNTVPFCQKIPSSKTYQKKKTSCWQTGESGDSIFWHREMLEGATLYVLHLEYPASRKSEMDSVVAHVNSSWHHPLNESDKGIANDEHEDAKNADPSSAPTVTYDSDTGKNSFRGNPFDCP